MSLAPMAVMPKHQRKGVGSALVRTGLEQCQQPCFGATIMLGHSDYYPHFGLSPATRYSIGCEYEVPEEAFMVVELRPGFLQDVSGKIKYHSAFDNLPAWAS